MTFEEQFALATSPQFVQRVQQAAITAAIATINGEPTETRLLDYCFNLLNRARASAQEIAFGVATNPAITAESTDNDIQFTVNSMLRAYAGVQPEVPE
jgi:hypothetical protein